MQKAKVGLNSGKTFGFQGEGYVRINLATQRSVLLEALVRIEKAIQMLNNSFTAYAGYVSE